MAHTTSDWLLLTSPAAKTPGTLDMYASSVAMLPQLSRFTPRFSIMPLFTGPVKPIANSTKSASIVNSLPAMGSKPGAGTYSHGV